MISEALKSNSTLKELILVGDDKEIKKKEKKMWGEKKKDNENDIQK